VHNHLKLVHKTVEMLCVNMTKNILEMWVGVLTLITSSEGYMAGLQKPDTFGKLFELLV